MEVGIIVAYIIGTVFGMWVGYNQGVTTGIVKTMDHLVEGNFIKTQIDEDGQLLIEPLD